MATIFAKLRDSGGSFIVGRVQFLGKKPLEVDDNPAILDAIKAGALVKLSEEDYKEDLKKFNEEQAFYKSQETGSQKTDGAGAVPNTGLPIPSVATMGEIAIADMTVVQLKDALSQNFPSIEIPANAKKADLVKLLTDAAEAAKAKDQENGDEKKDENKGADSENLGGGGEG